MFMKSDDVLKFEDDLRKVESELEELGRRICDFHGSNNSWCSINDAIENVRDAIHDAYYMDELQN